MAVNALAGIMVSDLTTAEAWAYEQLLSRPADARPMEGLAEGSSRTVDGSSVSRQGSCRILLGHISGVRLMINSPN